MVLTRSKLWKRKFLRHLFETEKQKKQSSLKWSVHQESILFLI